MQPLCGATQIFHIGSPFTVDRSPTKLRDAGMQDVGKAPGEDDSPADYTAAQW